MKKLFTIFIILLLVLIVGLAGDLDHDEYIEAKLTPKVKILNY